mgnify:CR=1 FL=1
MANEKMNKNSTLTNNLDDIKSLIALFAPKERKQELFETINTVLEQNTILESKLRSTKALLEEQQWKTGFPEWDGIYLVARYFDESDGPGYYETAPATFGHVGGYSFWYIDGEIETSYLPWRSLPKYEEV